MATLRARYVVESRRWEDLPLPEVPLASATAGARTSAVYGSRANQLVAAGFSAAHLGRHADAEEAARRLRAIGQQRRDAGSAYDAQPIEIMATQVEGLSKFLKGDQQAGLEQLASAAQLEEKLDPPERARLPDQALARALRRGVAPGGPRPGGPAGVRDLALEDAAAQPVRPGPGPGRGRQRRRGDGGRGLRPARDGLGGGGPGSRAGRGQGLPAGEARGGPALIGRTLTAHCGDAPRFHVPAA